MIEVISSGALQEYLMGMFDANDANGDGILEAAEFDEFVYSVIESGEIFTGTPLAQPVTEAEISAFQTISYII